MGYVRINVKKFRQTQVQERSNILTCQVAQQNLINIRGMAPITNGTEILLLDDEKPSLFKPNESKREYVETWTKDAYFFDLHTKRFLLAHVMADHVMTRVSFLDLQ